MGGHFWEGYGLNTPRMPPDVYLRMLNHVTEQLRPLFARVEHAIDAPEKSDHGDLDILVLQKPGLTLDELAVQKAKIAEHLSAFKIEHNGVGMITLALPWLDADFRPVADKYVQVDLRIWEDKVDLDWSLFTQCNGDLINILAALTKPKGLTITNRALSVRIPEIEAHNKKVARVELTRTPTVVLEYLGLDTDRFFQPFETREQMMKYIAGCRFHDPTRVNRVVYEEENMDEKVAGTLNDYDKKRLELRPIFREWYQDFMPKHQDMPVGSAARLTREETLEDVFQFFGEEIRQRYYEQKAKAVAVTRKITVFHTVREELEGRVAAEDINDTVKGVKKMVRGELEVAEVATLYESEDFDGVIEWARKHHAVALKQYRDWLASQSHQVKDMSKKAPYSTKEVESYSAADDEVILCMKQENGTWSEILKAIDKTSRSQLVAHGKQDLAHRAKLSVVSTG